MVPDSRLSRKWVAPRMVREQVPAGAGAVRFTYQLPVWSAMVSVAVVPVTLAAARRDVVNVSDASSSALSQPLLLYAV